MEQLIQQALFSNEIGFMLVATVFAAGLLTSLTPCVYPMLPITVAVVGNHANNKWQASIYSLLYVLGLATTYAGLGVLAASAGQLFGAIATHPVTLGAIALICLFMAASMMGWINLPQWQPTTSSGKKQRTVPARVFLMGLLSGLVMAPCTSPVLGMLLMYVGSQGEPVLGGVMMFSFALGMSALLVAAGIFSGLLNLLPRSGNWLNVIKYLLAALMAGAGFYFLWQSAQSFNFS